MLIFAFVDVDLEGNASLYANVLSTVDRVRFILQLLRDAKEAGNFGRIVRLEYRVKDYSAW